MISSTMPALPVADLPRPVAIVCHDAGAANIIFAGLQGPTGPLRVFAAGPAAKIASAFLPGVELLPSIPEALDGAASLISGTGWATNFEHDARVAAAATGIVSVAVIDHWVNYPERFIRDGQRQLPQRIWVSDPDAVAEARRHFDPATIDLVPNAYLDGQLKQIVPNEEVSSQRLLYVLEPMRSDWARGVPGEFQALDYLVSNLERLGLPADLQIALRPHPSEAANKYDAWRESHGHLSIVMDTSPDMASAISRARWIAGCESFGLVLALKAGRKVFCTLPPWAPACRLPQTDLVHIKTLDRRS